ncbi:hypothetical protein ACFWPV_02745 [Streptomyces uncialis]|uniref:hypothetical protein n=1 Tax=Streptomyces uncialis TaxID=1048205 RepID=UPI0036536889
MTDTAHDETGEGAARTTADSAPRFGRIVDRQAYGGGPQGRVGTYVVQDDADGRSYSFDYTDIVTEGFRTIRSGERVRFHLPRADAWRAIFVIRLDQPDPEVFYE